MGNSSPGEEEEGQLFPGRCCTAQPGACSSTTTSCAKDIGDGQWGPVKPTGAEGAMATSLATLLWCGVVLGPCAGEGEGPGFWLQCWHQDQQIQVVP